MVFVALWPFLSIADEPSDAPGKLAPTVQQEIHDLRGVWAVRIENTERRVIATLTIRFEDGAARSCMSGDWKRVVVLAHQSSDEDFFPASEPLSYTVTGNELTIGRNEICDAYRHLKGPLSGDAVTGEYFSLGLGGGKRLGYFTLSKVP
jgi:hypothetical protein